MSDRPHDPADRRPDDEAVHRFEIRAEVEALLRLDLDAAADWHHAAVTRAASRRP